MPRQRAEQSGPLLGRQLHELRGDEVVGILLGRADEEIGLAPLDAGAGHGIGLPRVLRPTLHSNAQHVGRHHIPAELGQPDGVGALPAPDVERTAGPEMGHFGDELRVGVAAPGPRAEDR